MNMNNRVNILYSLILLGLSSIFCNQLFGQEKVNISLGMGIPELLNLGIRYQIKQVQAGISFGTLPTNTESLISVSGDIYYHFGGISELSNRRPWYGRIGLNYLQENTNSFNDKKLVS